MSSTPPTNSTSSIDGSWSDCAESHGETTCGSICCATGQYCTKEDQCVDFTSTGCDPSNDQCSIGTAQSAATSFTTSVTYSSAAATSFTAISSSLPTTTTLSSLETSSLIVSTSEISSTVGSSTATSSIMGSTAMLLSSTSLAAIAGTGVATSTSTPPPFPTASPSTSVTSKSVFKAGISIAVIALVAIVSALIFYLLRRNRHQNSVRPPTGEVPGSFGLIRPANYGPDEPPNPHPYTEVFPQHQSPTPTLAPRGGNRSQFNTDIAPDLDTGNIPPPPNLRHSPALNPYNRNFPSVGTRGGLPGDGESTISTPTPNYGSRRL